MERSSQAETAPEGGRASADEARPRYRLRIETLDSLGGRAPTSESESRAADYLLEQLRSAGIVADKVAFAGCRSMAPRVLVHVGLAMVGLAAVRRVPLLTSICALVALISLVIEQMTWGVWLSRWFCNAPSFNVVGRMPARGAAVRRIVLCAHVDTQPGGWIWSLQRLAMPLYARAPLHLKPPMQFLSALMLAQAGTALAARTGRMHGALWPLAAGLLAVYLAFGILLVQWMLGRAVPGAADNASGVAAVLEIAEAWIADPPADDVELLVLLTGCEESGMLGATAWARATRRDRTAPPTIVLNVDGIGMGPPRFLGAEVPAVGVPLRVPQPLLEACVRVAARMSLADCGPHALPGPTDGLAFLAHGFAAVSVVGFAAGPRFPHYHTHDDTAANMDFAAARAGTEFARAVAWELARLPLAAVQGTRLGPG